MECEHCRKYSEICEYMENRKEWHHVCIHSQGFIIEVFVIHSDYVASEQKFPLKHAIALHMCIHSKLLALELIVDATFRCRAFEYYAMSTRCDLSRLFSI